MQMVAIEPKTNPALLKARGSARIPVPRELLSKLKNDPKVLKNKLVVKTIPQF